MSARASIPGEIEFRVGLGSCGIANGARPVREAVAAYVAAVQEGEYPSAEESYDR